jgi:hypothetical protein
MLIKDQTHMVNTITEEERPKQEGLQAMWIVDFLDSGIPMPKKQQ